VLPGWLVNTVLLGLVFGSLAGLNSIGFVLLWRTTRVVNLAQPALGLVGGVITAQLVVNGEWSFWWAAPVGIVAGACLAVLTDRLVLARLHDVPRSILLVATVGLAQIFDGIRVAVAFMFGNELPTTALDLGFTWNIFPVNLLSGHILAIVCFPLVVYAVHRFMTRSRIGVAALALGQDTERARSLGIPAAVVRSAVWAIAGAIAALSGMLTIFVQGFSLGGSLPPTVLLLALAPAVFAGLRSITRAAVASILLGMAYQLAGRFSTSGTLAVLALAVFVIVAVAVQGQNLGRGEAAQRASSWEAAATTRPLPWKVSASGGVFFGGLALVLFAIAAVAVPAYLLSPSQLVAYGVATAITLGAVAVGIAWLFAGELPLGHWGFAGLAAALATRLPGPWGFRAAIAAAVAAGVGAFTAFGTRRRSSLSFAVVGLAIAAAGQAAVLFSATGKIPGDPRLLCVAGGVLCVAAVVGAIKLRASTYGAGLVAARDDPERAKWFGVDPVRGRIVALALSTGIAGLAGVVFGVAIQSTGLIDSSFTIERSLALLAMAVVGGVSSPVGVLVGAIALQAGQLLPRPWDGMTSGVGVVAVVLFLPAGLSRVLERVRDAAVRLVARDAVRAEAAARQREPAGRVSAA